MLRQLKMTCFRKHEDRTVVFNKGLSAIKGTNEAGKSSMTEAILYALFGSGALRDSLADVVTYGRKESELKVELTIEVEGRMFNFKRSKSGAEAESDQGLVTGQKEVSNFAAQVLGADMNTVTKLMMANQNTLRGALEEGPKAVSTMIESLSDFDLFERILDQAQHKWIQGSPSVFESKVREAEQELATPQPELPSTQEVEDEIMGIQPQIDELDVKINDATVELGKAQANYQGAADATRMRESLDNNLRKAKEQQALHIEQKKAAEKKAAVAIDEAAIEQLKKDLADADAAEKRQEVFKLLGALTYPEVSWEGDKESFELELAAARDKVDTARLEATRCSTDVSKLKQEAAALKATTITDKVCPTCKRPHENLADIEEHNAKVLSQIKAFEPRIAEAEAAAVKAVAAIREAEAEVNDLKSVAKSALPFERFATQYGAYVAVDMSAFPPKLSWNSSPVEGDSYDKEGIRSRLVSLESAKEERDRADARSVALAQTLQEDAEHVERLEGQIALCPKPTNTQELQSIARQLGNQLVHLKNEKAELEARRKALQESIQKVKAEYDAAMLRRQGLEERLASARKDLDQINFNNALLKKIRAARPLIADKLWASVLGSVSVMFSQMRGEQSIVTKDKDGFAVNGKPITSLSGSTLDLLGMSIRVALTRTFLPHTSFMVLDEPGAAMDADRVESLLGFIASTGLDQTILISHESCVEAVADHIISL